MTQKFIGKKGPLFKIFLDAICTNDVLFESNTSFFYSTNKSINPCCSLENFIFLQKSVSATKQLRFFYRKNCRGPPVLRFLKFGNEGGQAYGKAIQNTGL